jgi:hypothetical protein
MAFQGLYSGDLKGIIDTCCPHRTPFPTIKGAAGPCRPSARVQRGGSRQSLMLLHMSQPKLVRPQDAREGTFESAPGATHAVPGGVPAAGALRFCIAYVIGLLARARHQVRQMVAALVVAAGLMFSGPLPSSAVSMCMPVPTPNGIARVCMDIGESAEKPVVPPSVNAHRTPVKSEGSMLSRAGIRPLTMFADAHAKIKATALERLEMIKFFEEVDPSIPQPSELKGPHRRKELAERGIDPITLKYGTPNVPRSQLVADTIDPVMVTSSLAFVVYVFRRQLARFLRRIVLPHHHAHHIVLLKVQVAIGGEDAPHLSTTCRTLARMIHEGIIAPRLTHRGYEEPEVKRGSEALTPAVRYSAFLLRNATKSDGLVHARVEVDALHTASEDERLEALDRWELMTLNEEMRGLPLREYPHRPGVFQYGTANECPKPGVAGIAVAPQTRWLDDWQSEDKEWDETMWRLPRNRSKAKP